MTTLYMSKNAASSAAISRDSSSGPTWRDPPSNRSDVVLRHPDPAGELALRESSLRAAKNRQQVAECVTFRLFAHLRLSGTRAPKAITEWYWTESVRWPSSPLRYSGGDDAPQDRAKRAGGKSCGA
jgi:hypothetical protein